MQDTKSMYRNLLHFYTTIMKQQKEIKKTTSFTMAPKIIRHLGINLTKEVKDLYSENYKTLIKEIEDNTKKWKDISCQQIGRTNIIKMSIIQKQSTYLIQSLSKYQHRFS